MKLNQLSRVFLAAIAAVILSGCASTSGEARTIKIATYNIENFFDAHDDPYYDDIDRYNDGNLLVKPKEELEALARVIRHLDADVIGLQEVENRGFLEQFNREYLKGMGYKEVVHVLGNDQRGIDVALLSRFDVGPVVSYRHLNLDHSTPEKPARFSRDLLEVTIRPPDAEPFHVYVAHLKSRGGGKEATLQRVAEANKIRQIWDYRLNANPKSLFVFLADINDDPPSSTFRILQGQGAKKVTAINAVCAAGKDYTQDSKYTDRYPPIRFDYVFASPAMNARLKSSAVLRPADTTSALFNDLRTASDHYPVYAIFDLGKK